MKKLLTSYLIASFLFFTSLQVRADLDVQNLAGTTIASAGALTAFMAVATGTAVALSGGLALGALGAAILIDNATNTPTTINSAPISIRLNPKVPLIVPNGWTAPSGSAVQPVPPTTTLFNNPNGGFTDQAYYSGDQYVGGYPLADSPALMCPTLIGKTIQGGNQPITQSTLNGTACNVTFINNASNSQTKTIGNSASFCPTGYVRTGADPNTVCSVSSPSAVVKPKKGSLEVVRTGNTLAIDPQANPADKIASPALTVSSTSATIVGSDGSITNVTINTDGTATITQTKPTATPGVSNQTKINVSAPDATTGDVTVTGINDQQVSGSGTAANTTPIPSSGGGSAPTIDISSLNKEVTQAAIKSNTDTIKTDVTDIKNAITNADNNPTDLADKKTEYDTIAQAHNDAVKAIGDGGLDNHGFAWNWSISVPAGTCTPFSHSFGGHAITMDYCPGIYAARDFAAWLFYIFTGMTLTSIVTRRPD